jgi:hypothetical protein
VAARAQRVAEPRRGELLDAIDDGVHREAR